MKVKYLQGSDVVSLMCLKASLTAVWKGKAIAKLAII